MINYTFKGVGRNQELVWMEISSVLTSWDGRPATLNLIRDMTRQKELEKQLLRAQRMEAVGTLAGGIAHEFNNLLQSVHGYAELLLLDLEADQARSDKLRRIMRSAQRGSELTQQLLDFSRRHEPQTQVLDLKELLERVAGLLERTLPKQIKIQLDLAPEALHVCADPHQLEQVLMNLAVNARDAMPNGGSLTIQTDTMMGDVVRLLLPPASASEYIRIKVSDTGMGMSELTIKRIFDPFFTTKDFGKGTGLGLSIIYGIVTNHNGFILVDSAEGKGTTFTVYLPVPQEAESLEISTDQTNGDIAGGNETILIVEDENMVWKLFTGSSGEKRIPRDNGGRW